MSWINLSLEVNSLFDSYSQEPWDSLCERAKLRKNAYYAKHRETILAANKTPQQRAKLRLYSARYRARHPEKARADNTQRCRRYYEKMKDDPEFRQKDRERKRASRVSISKRSK